MVIIMNYHIVRVDECTSEPIMQQHDHESLRLVNVQRFKITN